MRQNAILRMTGLAMGISWLIAGQELPRPVTTTRIINGVPADVFQRISRLAARSGIFVQAYDPTSGLLSFSLPLHGDDRRSSVAEAHDIPHMFQMAHVVVRATPHDPEHTRVAMHAAVDGAGIFLHSSGSLEEQFLNALESGSPWRESKPIEKSARQTAGAIWERLAATVRESGYVVNMTDRASGMLTCTAAIASNDLQAYSSQKGLGGRPGLMVLTFRVSPDGSGSRLAVRSILLEVGRYATEPPPSNGVLEQKFLARVTGDGAELPRPSEYRRAGEFWQAMFESTGGDPMAIEQSGSRRDLPAPLERVWDAAIIVTAQSAVITRSDRKGGVLAYVSTHASGDGMTSHWMALRLVPNALGTTIYLLAGPTPEAPGELAAEKEQLLEKIATQLFLKERLKWLTGV